MVDRKNRNSYLNLKLKEPDNVIGQGKGEDDDDKEQAMTPR